MRMGISDAPAGIGLRLRAEGHPPPDVSNTSRFARPEPSYRIAIEMVWRGNAVLDYSATPNRWMFATPEVASDSSPLGFEDLEP